jgi:hypothetical protein
LMSLTVRWTVPGLMDTGLSGELVDAPIA